MDEVWVINARHMRNVPGRKTDVADSQWGAQLLEHGLVRPSFIPPKPFRQLRDLTRYRRVVIEERGRESQRVHPYEAAVTLLVTIPGVARRSAQVILAEIGVDMSRFPSAGHLASWAGMCPGNNESAHKHRSGSTRHGSKWLRIGLIEAAHAAARTKNTYLAAQYARLRSKRGPSKAAVAVGHSILVIAWHLLSTGETYNDLGGDYFEKRRNSTARQRRLVAQLEAMGHNVILEPAA